MPIEGTNLLYVKNTTGNVFKSISDQLTYVLVTGRWFSAPGFDGPWVYVTKTMLPADFASIPARNIGAYALPHDRDVAQP